MFKILHIPTACIDDTSICAGESTMSECEEKLFYYLDWARSIRTFDTGKFIFSALPYDWDIWDIKTRRVEFVPEHFMIVEVEDEV